MNRSCPACRCEDLPTESRFCMHCGAALAAPEAEVYTPAHLAPVLALDATREGERKDVTVLVADVAGSLAMAHRLDPEDLHALMTGFFELATDAVHAEHGTLNQYRGDGFMALFGAPVARGSHALDAIRAALALRQRVEAYDRTVQSRFGVTLLLRMGIHTGSVWVGAIGGGRRRDYTVEGTTAGLAVRLEQAAQPGQILISAEAARRVGPLLELRALGAFEPRGAPEPLEAFEVVGKGAHESPLDAERALGLVPFAGRAGEIARLTGRLDALAPGGALWIEIAGEPGIGKSRLALELRARDAGAWLEGRAREIHGAHAYSLWSDLLRRWMESRAAPASVAALARMLEGREPRGEPAAVERALRSAIAEVEGSGPVSIFFEDAQWMDVSSKQLVGRLLDEPPARGVRFLVTARSDGLPLLDAPWPSERIVLGPLERSSAASIALAVLASQSDPEPLAALAAERGGGNPLFVLELARALGEGGEALRDAARLEMAWHRAPAQLPQTLRDVIAARLDSLDEPAKRVLQIASVVGRAFSPTWLEVIAAGERVGVPACLERLIEQGVLARSGDEIDFGHGLYREVAYEQLLRARRRELHRRCATVLEASDAPWPPSLAAEIGLHYDRAGELARAVRAYARAGDGHLALFAARESVVQLRRAWEIVCQGRIAVDGTLRTGVALSLARALNLLDRAHEAGAILELLSAEDVSGEEERARLAEAWIESAWVRFSEANDCESALPLLERALGALGGEGRMRHLEARAHAYRVRVCHLDGAVERAAESAQRVVALASAAGERVGVAFGLGNEGYVLCDAGDVGRAHELCSEAYALARDLGSDVSLSLAAAFLSKAHVFRGDCEAALRVAGEARELGLRSGQLGAVYNADIWAGAAFLLGNEPKRAADSFERLAEINDRWPTTLDWLAVARLETGRLEEAVELARRCLAARPPRLIRLRALRTLGTALWLARPEERESAERSLGDALALGLELALRPHVAETHRVLADLCREHGDARRADYYQECAVSAFTACGMPLHADLARGPGATAR